MPKMLLYVCDRCKFSSPGSEALCQTCGAKVRKQEAVKEVLYRLQGEAPDGIMTHFEHATSAVIQFFSAIRDAFRAQTAKSLDSDLDVDIPPKVRVRRS